MAETGAKKKVGEKILEQMKRMLISGQWKPGEKIPTELELMEIFQASRISVREPIKQLVSLGLLETRQGSGTFVRAFNEEIFIAPIKSMVYTQKLTKQDILYILDVRKIEIIIAGLAAERSNKEGIRQLREIHKVLEEGCNDPVVHQKTDLKFHLAICKMTENPYLLSVCKLLYESLDMALQAIVPIMGPQKALHYHSKLIDTISRHYVQEAKATMEEHLKTTFEAIMSIPEDADVFKSLWDDKE